MASRNLYDLHPQLQQKAASFLTACKLAGIDVAITCTYRSNAEQAKLYAQGRTAPGKRVTNAKPGQSLHNLVDALGHPASWAIDVVPLRHGKAVWDAADPIWMQVGQFGESAGLEWGGNWKKFKDFPHFQVRP